jgi:hypothetical protein
VYRSGGYPKQIYSIVGLVADTIHITEYFPVLSGKVHNEINEVLALNPIAEKPSLTKPPTLDYLSIGLYLI